MSSVGGISPFRKNIPDDDTLHVLSFLDARSVQASACVSKGLQRLADDFQVWKPRTEIDFGKIIALGAKRPNISWKQLYNALSASKKDRVDNVAKVHEAQVKKTSQDDIQFRTSSAFATLLGLPMPNPSRHYYPTGQTGQLGRFKITVMKSTQ